MRFFRLFIYSSTVIVIVAVFFGLSLIDSPMTARKIRLDLVRVDNLVTLSRAIDLYWLANEELPESLEDLDLGMERPIPLKDPDARSPYQFELTGGRSYQLCAVFQTDIRNTDRIRVTSISLPIDRDRSLEEAIRAAQLSMEREWAHPSGAHCFDLEVPEYP